MTSEAILFDKANPQEDYQYMAKGISDGKYYIGYIVVDKPWYSNESEWTYYIVRNRYGSGSICGGAIDLGLERVVVDRTTIEPYTQIANIKYNQSMGWDSILVKSFLEDDDDPNNRIAFIGANDKIPVELWNVSQ